MADYSKQLFDMFGSFGDTARDNRLEARRNMEDDRNYAHTLERFQFSKDTDQRDYDRGVFENDRGYGLQEREFGANQDYRNRSLGLQERNYQRGILENDRDYELRRMAAERQDAPNIETFYTQDGRETKGIYDPRAPGGFVPIGGAKGGAGPQVDFESEAKLRGEYLKGSGDFMSVRDSYGRLQAATKDETGASDIAAVYSFMKMLDPGSVVREGEFATAEQAGGLPDRLVSLYNKVVNGERLSPDVRKQFLQQAGQQYAGALDRQNRYGETYRSLSNQYGFEPSRITPDLSAGVQPPAAGPAEPINWNDLGGGVRMRQVK